MTPNEFFQKKVTEKFPPHLQLNFKRDIGMMMGGFFWGIEYMEKKRKQIDLTKKEDILEK